MINFTKLRWKNFLSTGNIFTEIELDKNNTTLIVGENGSGKSTMLDALSFSLFGKAFRKINKPQLINSITNREMVVEVEFNIGKNMYKIKRGMKPNVFEVYLNDRLLNQSADMRDYQEILEKQILKVNHKSFSQVVVLGSATFQPFMQLPAGQRRDIIEDLLDLQIFTKMNLLLKDKVIENADELSRLNSEKKLIEEKIRLTKKYLQELQLNNQELVKEKIKLQVETEGLMAELSVKCNELNGKILSLKSTLEDDAALKKNINRMSSLRHQIEAKLKHIKTEIDFFNKHDDCPTCKQPIDLKFKCETVDSKEKEVKEIEDGLALLVEKYDALDEKINQIFKTKDEINTLTLELNVTETKYSSYESYWKGLEAEIRGINKKVANKDETDIKKYEKELKKLHKDYVTASEEKNVLSVASVLLKDGGIKSKIIKQYVPIINKLINKYLSAMDFYVQFELDEEFNETIKSRFRDEFSYASFSEGEKMRINLAILFTWRAVAKLRNSINTNILIMDEVFDSSLDSNGTEEFLKVLNTLTQDTNTFIISHKTDQLYDKFERVIKFEKHKNFSKIV